jgi:hypothetical protein
VVAAKIDPLSLSANKNFCFKKIGHHKKSDTTKKLDTLW